MSKTPTIVWLRQDLRIADNAALRLAAMRGPVVPVFVWSPGEEGKWPMGAAARWWLHHSLASLSEHLARLGSRLVFRAGDVGTALRSLARTTGAQVVLCNRRYEPAAIGQEKRVQQALATNDIGFESFNASLLLEPWAVKTKGGTPFQVFTPFWKTCLSRTPDAALPAPRKIAAPSKWPASDDLGDFGLLPRLDWAAGFADEWEPGEPGAWRRLRAFLKKGFPRYDRDRSRLDLDGSSRLSPHLRFGEISPRQVWHAIMAAGGTRGQSAKVFLAEIGWREFAYHQLFHFPQTPSRPLRAAFERFPWKRRPAALKRWRQGLTGYPMVDAAMRQLWATGWMPNRARMIVASFLTKDLLIPWQEGAAWFWDTLLDADLANNTLGWQWTAGCGADAGPFFRIFNPLGQAEKFDPQGDYIRRWIPELAKLPPPWIFQPWDAPAQVLRSCSLRLGDTYPKQMIDHAEARNTALAAYGQIRGR